MSSEKLCGTQFTIDWLVDVLKSKLNNEKAELKDFSAAKNTAGSGFLSHIITVDLHWTHGDGGTVPMPSSVVVKVPTFDILKSQSGDVVGKEDERGKAELAMMMSKSLPVMHTVEKKTYELLSGVQNPVCRMPKFYYGQKMSAQEDGVLVMEDFSKTAVPANIGDGLSLKQIYQVVDAIVEFQSYTLKMEDQNVWKSLSSRKTLKKELDAALKFDEIAKYLGAVRPDYFPAELLNNVRPALQTDFLVETTKNFCQLWNIAPTLVHGDLWCNNLLFIKDEESQPTDQLAAVIDWQFCHHGNMTEDIGRVLIASCDGETRRRETPNILKYYFETLKSKMADQNCPFLIDDVAAAWEAQIPFAVAFYLLAMPLMINGGSIDGPRKEERAEAMYLRAKYGLEDVQAVKDKLMSKIMSG